MSTAYRRRNGGRAATAVRIRLEARREEIEAAALTRVRAIADPGEVSDPAYAEGLRAAVVAAVAYGIETTGREGADPPIPVTLLAQARLAARARISLDTVLRRYFAGYSLLGYFILEEASHVGLTDGTELKRLLAAHAGLFDRLLAAVGEEYAREAETLALATGERRRAERIERLLAGEPGDTSDIPYDFDGWHVGIVAEGVGAEQHVRKLAASFDCRLLLLLREEGVVWAWLGARRRPDAAVLRRAVDADRGEGASGAPTASPEAQPGPAIVFGEPGEGQPGWRLTHRQAAAALPISQSGPERVVSYADVALLACAARDELLSGYLREAYLAPLGIENGKESAKQTLLAYFAAGRNVSAAAAALGLTRQSMRGRLATIEARIGRALGECAAELELALRLSEHRAGPDRREAPGRNGQIAGADALGA